MTTYAEEHRKQRQADAESQALSTPLFSGLDHGYIPTRPTVTRVEQRSLPIQGTLEGEYHAWRATALGEFVVETMRMRALDLVRRGATRVGVKALAEWVRGEKQVEVNNSLVALVARELREREPELRDRIELRQRTAA